MDSVSKNLFMITGLIMYMNKSVYNLKTQAFLTQIHTAMGACTCV